MLNLTLPAFFDIIKLLYNVEITKKGTARMKRLPTHQLIPGMIVADDVMTSNHQVILPKDTVLTDAQIMKLDLYGVLAVHVQDRIAEQPLIPPAFTGSSYYERVKKSPEFKAFKKSYEEELDSFKGMINKVVEKNTQLDVKELLSRSLLMVADAKGHVSILDMLHNMREYDDSTFAHCLNVGLICNVFARWLKLPDAEVEMATACGLLHDVGKLLVPHDILTKPGKLTDPEYHQVKKHSYEGYKLLLSQNIDQRICNAALMHHERCDGSGYPQGLMADEIDSFARIVAIVDVYDAMTAARVYRAPLCPFKVIEVFESEGLQRYDATYVLCFLENIVNTYIQNRCRLSDGREGTIIFINRPKLSRPVVQCADGYVDLAEKPELCIETLL